MNQTAILYPVFVQVLLVVMARCSWVLRVPAPS